MSLPYFLTDDPAAGTLTGAEAKHAHVKRIQPGERIMLIDGQGSTALTRVTSVGAGRVDGVVEKLQFVPQPTPRVTVVQAVPKGERAELAKAHAQRVAGAFYGRLQTLPAPADAAAGLAVTQHQPRSAASSGARQDPDATSNAPNSVAKSQ